MQMQKNSIYIFSPRIAEFSTEKSAAKFDRARIVYTPLATQVTPFLISVNRLRAGPPYEYFCVRSNSLAQEPRYSIYSSVSIPGMFMYSHSPTYYST